MSNAQDLLHDLPLGFDLYQLERDVIARGVSLLLPQQLAQALAEEKRAAELQVRSQERSDDAPVKVQPSAWKKAPAAEPEEPPPTLPAYDPSNAMPVYAPDVPHRLLRGMQGRTPDREVHKRLEALAKELKAKGPIRRLVSPPEWDADVEVLRRHHPHFHEVLELVDTQVRYSWQTESALRLPPMLLAGPPGVGKTHFSQDLATVLDVTIRRVPFDTEQTGSVLLGSDKTWANSSYGVVFELLALGRQANPLILLDEIDKASRYRENSPLASLHSLLEPVTAGQVRDISLDLELDASRVTWIATANEPDRIPDSLRSRFTEFWIEQPTGEQALGVAESVLKQAHLRQYGSGLETPSRRIPALIAHLSAREQMQLLELAYARMVAAGRSQLRPQDLPPELWPEGPGAAAGWLH